MSANGQLPKGWVMAKLGDLLSPVGDRVSPSGNAGLPFVGLEHIEAHTMRLLGTVPAETMKSSCIQFHPGNVLYGRLRPYLNKVFHPDFHGLCSAEFIVLPDLPHLRSSFLKYRLNAGDFVSFATHLNAGDRPRVDFDQIRVFEIALPPEQEQRRIVAKIEELFSDLDAGVAALERVKANLKRYRASVLKAAVEGKLTAKWRAEHPNIEPAPKLLQRILLERRKKWEADQLAKFQAAGKTPSKDWQKKYEEPTAPDTTNLPKLPKGWCWGPLEGLMRKIVDGTHHTPTYISTGVPFISVKDIQNGHVLFADCKYISAEQHSTLAQRCRPERGDILITKSGTIGRVAIVRTDQPFSLFVSVALLKPASSQVLTEWIAIAFQAWMLTVNVANDIKGSTIKNLHLEDFRELSFPLPPLNEQRLMIASVEEHLSKMKKAEEQIELSLVRASRLRQSILKRAFEGKLVPQDPTDKPATDLLECIRQSQTCNKKPGQKQPRRKRQEVEA